MRFGVLGYVGCSAAIFATERKPLKEAQRYKQDGRQPTDRGERRQEPDGERRGAHNNDRDEERVFAASEIANAAEGRTRKPAA
jgi:hypothetical protein